MRAKYLIGLIFVGMALVASQSALSQDALRVRQLESDVMRLERDLEAQSRRIDELERSVRNAGTKVPSVAPDAGRRSAEGSPAWLLATNWDRVRPGMKDIEVIALLGRPTSVRTESDGKTHALLYALELGPTAVLAGNVELNESGVAQVNKPTLR
jgi:hypothetical protein